ncbi:helix-turn-helix domain-containing protein [Paenibacillus sp. GYB003]|uniref:helix-turn-helix domain-containing protein n=1 Tax=Paenibacillus sp. GYB003 TaxID=2994392 RepID=UPI002F96497E
MELVQKKNSYMFRFRDGTPSPPIGITAVGWEDNFAGYSFDGLTRTDGGGPYLFQYTLSGRGEIRIGDRTFPLGPGKAFMIPFYGDYRYFLPGDSDHYECIFISLEGDEVAKCWSALEGALGPVFYLPDYSVPIRTLKYIHHEASMKQITDAYKASAMGYQFVMELYRFRKGYDLQKKWPDVVAEAAKLLQEQYGEIDGLDGVAARLGVTKSHLIKLFHRTVGKTPIEFLTKVRMEKAVELLRRPDLSVEAIALAVGYADVSYFVKVFRKCFGLPPGRFRKNHSTDHVVLFD